MKSTHLVIWALLGWMSPLLAQTIQTYEDRLVVMTDTLMLSEELHRRQAAFDETVVTLKKALRSDPASFSYPFSKLKRTSIVQAPDSTFRVFTGQLFMDEDRYQYFGLIQLNDSAGTLIELTDNGWTQQDLLHQSLTEAQWPGALYYQLRQFEKEGKTYYLACGFNNFRMFENRKIAEVFYFENDQLVLGAPVFVRPGRGETLHRMIKSYSADVGIRLTFDDDLNMLMFDHLIPMRSPYQSKKTVLVPDGSYSAYALQADGSWIYIDKVFNHTVVTPPRERPVLNADGGKDLFGKSGKRR